MGAREVVDLSKFDMTGASAGSLAGVFCACEVDMEQALVVALDLCRNRGVFDRPLGLMGVWGNIVADWLDILLPGKAPA